MRQSISYAITVHNEHDEIYRLLNQLILVLYPEDEIVIQGDQGRVTDEVVSVLHKFLKNAQIKYIEYPLRKDFASFKNNLFKNCEKDWIFQIDADEMLGHGLLQDLKSILAENVDSDMFRVARVNIVEGLTQDLIDKWHWSVNDKNWINFPDFQQRIVKNGKSIKWKNKVHEVLDGYTSWSDLPQDAKYALIHIKSAERQIKQNEFYSTI